MTKNILLIIIIIMLAILGFILLRRPAAPPVPPDTAVHPPPIPPESIKTRSGIVLGYKNNAHLDVDAIQLKTTQDGIITVDFRPHTAKAVMDHAPVGDSVRIFTSSKPNDEYIVYELHRIENLRTRQTADLDALPPPPDVPPNYTAENFTVDHPQLLTDPYGGIDAIREGNLLFHFKPGLVDDISGLIKSAQTITLSCVRRSEDFGFVNINHDKVYIVLSVTVDNKTFLVR